MKQTVTICSVYFRPLDATLSLKSFNGVGYTSHFHIDAAKPGEFKTLKVGNYHERTYIGSGQYSDTPIYCDAKNGVAAALVGEWAHHVREGTHGGPGIFLCEGDEPTEKELEWAREMQTRWANRLCLLAEVDWIAGHKMNIDTVQREAAVWLNRAEEYEWVSDRGTARVQACPMCAKSIDARATVCPNCHNIVDFNQYSQYLEKKIKLEAQLKAAGIEVAPVAPVQPPIKNPQQQKIA